MWQAAMTFRRASCRLSFQTPIWLRGTLPAHVSGTAHAVVPIKQIQTWRSACRPRSTRLQCRDALTPGQMNDSVAIPYDSNASLSRSEKMKAYWRDLVWRDAMLESRSSVEVARKRSEKMRKKWQDPLFRQKMRESRMGRRAWNLGTPPSKVTRLRMSVARKGVKKSEETKRRMSESKVHHPDKSWKRLISEAKLGKTRQYLQMRREYRALKADLRLWSDSYRLKYGRLPPASNVEEAGVAPMLALKIRRYVMLRGALDDDAAETEGEREILHFNDA